MRRGWKTSEFWITVATVIGAGASIVAALPVASVATVAAGVGVGAYNIARAIEKYGHATAAVPPPSPDGLK